MGEDTQVSGGHRSDLTTIHFQRAYDWSATPPSIATVSALATVTGIDPTELAIELETTLYDHVDPDALDELVRDQKSELVTVSFTFDHYRILFEGDKLTVRSHDR
ncbi:hypothetical protein Htur_4895 (plasmid) [Haloterrigena turkmenica DSM 5511]|uniref:Halobacterial output domain-containing protein n=1 Tax=Haloterrigena turkmenica (strain ATCC 51198 / DSM 5511 / JCM 9101 / NCIMB 13204 / VKM B-1734 / 4k) TaxID=543526 RepID=D2S2P4_HALTV|nr:HalOD1 output domain-containing protein [Haloterrigena turkmenica]ADB63641.1 hypothetical protein Htur_4895 [Haloterrigena turkmenica DSM 5511]